MGESGTGGKLKTFTITPHPSAPKGCRSLSQNPWGMWAAGPGSGIKYQGMNNSCSGPSQVTGAGISGDRCLSRIDCRESWGSRTEPGSRPSLVQMPRLYLALSYVLYL